MCPWHPQLLHWFLGSTHATVRICNWTQRGQLTLGMFLPCMKWMQKLSNWNALIYIFVTYTFISLICLWEMKMRYVSLQVAFLFDVFIVTMWFLVPLYVAYRIFSHLLFNIIFVLVHVVSQKKRRNENKTNCKWGDTTHKTFVSFHRDKIKHLVFYCTFHLPKPVCGVFSQMAARIFLSI